MPVHFLNKQIETNRKLPPPTQRGVWQTREPGDFLREFAHDIYVAENRVEGAEVNSVPSVFGRPILFAQALLHGDEKRASSHPLTKSLQAQWRGLLAAIALEKWRGLRISFEPFDVPHESQTKLGSILRNQLPNEEWSRFWVVKSNGSVIGATSPWTVVWTGANVSLPASIPWQENGTLADPIRHFQKHPEQEQGDLALLYQWVVQVLRGKAKWLNSTAFSSNGFGADHGEPNGRAGQALAYRNKCMERVENWFSAWRDELQSYADTDAATAFVEPKIESPLLRLFLLQCGNLTRIPTQFDLDSEQRVVVIPKTNRLLTTAYRNNWFPQGLDMPSMILAEDAFFPQRLVKLGVTSEAATLPGLDTYALPVTTDLVRYLGSKAVADLVREQRLEVRQIGQDQDRPEVDVFLHLPIKRSGNPLVISRRYSGSDFVSFEFRGHAFGFWPDFYSRDWKFNFAVASVSPSESRIAIRVLTDVPAGGGEVHQTATETSLEESAPSAGNRKQVRVWQLKDPVAGFVFEHSSPRDGRSEAGILLRANRVSAPPPNEQWELGFDFGTSNTAVSVKRPKGDVELLKLAGRTVILAGRSSETEYEEIKHNFFPLKVPGKDTANAVTPPFPTLLYSDRASFFDADINHSIRFAYLDPADESDRPIPDLKWPRQTVGGATRSPMKDYLELLLICALAEARAGGASSVKLCWSYPLSLPEASRKEMTGFWQTALSIARKAGLSVPKVYPMPESAAAFRSLSSNTAANFNGFADELGVLVDVGGGSTDVALWTKGSMKEQFSFKLAANDVLIPDWLRLKGGVSEILAACREGKSLPPEVVARIRANATGYFNAVLSEKFARNPALHPVITRIWSGSLKANPWLQARSMAYLFFSGVAFYLGVRCSSQEAARAGVEVYWCGRGISLLNWIALSDDLEEMLKFAVRAGYAFASGAPAETLKVQMLGPAFNYQDELVPLKHEVAMGLLPVTDEKMDADYRPRTVSGEAGWKLNGSEIRPNEEIKDQCFKDLAPPDEASKTLIQAFSESVLPRFAEANNLDAVDFEIDSSFWPKVQNRLGNPALQANDGEGQPLFIRELKLLMEFYRQRAVAADKQ